MTININRQKVVVLQCIRELSQSALRRSVEVSLVCSKKDTRIERNLNSLKTICILNLLYRMLSDIQYMSNIAQMGGQVDDLATKIPSTTVRMAIAVIGFLPIIIIYPFVQKNFVKGIAVGAVKG